MDLRRLRVGEWLCALSGVALIALLFAPWYEAGGPSDVAETSVTAFGAFAVIDILLVFVGLVAVGQLFVAAAARTAAPGVMTQAMFVPIAFIASCIAFVRVLSPPDSVFFVDQVGSASIGTDLALAQQFWAWIGVAACLATLVGALLAMRDERLSQPGRLTDQTGRPIAAEPDIPTLPAPTASA